MKPGADGPRALVQQKALEIYSVTSKIRCKQGYKNQVRLFQITMRKACQFTSGGRIYHKDKERKLRQKAFAKDAQLDPWRIIMFFRVIENLMSYPEPLSFCSVLPFWYTFGSSTYFCFPHGCIYFSCCSPCSPLVSFLLSHEAS